MKPRITAFIPAFIWFIITVVLLVLPGEDIPISSFLDEIQFDKFVHAGMFGLLTLLSCFPFLKIGMGNMRLFLKITLGAIIYGILMEYVQKYIAIDRDFDVMDMLADSIGALLAWGWLGLRLKKNKTSLI